MFSPKFKTFALQVRITWFSWTFFRVNAGSIWYFFGQFTVVQFDFSLISNLFSCPYANITLGMELWH